MSKPRRRALRLGVAGWIAIAVVVTAVVVAIAAPWLAPQLPTGGSILEQFEPPSVTHPLGTDVDGNDILSRLMYGARPSLLGPLLVVVLALLIGVPIALASAWRGGVIDTAIGRALDLIFAFPTVLIAALLVLVVGRGLPAAIVAISIAYIPYTTRLTRTMALRERNKAYILACEVQGLSTAAIMFRHLLPNISRFIIAQATIAFGFALIDLAALSFIGIGIIPPAPDWGIMVGDTTSIAQGNYTGVIAAAGCIVAIVGAFTLLGNRLDEGSELK
ncbi:MAG: ABC transporter permease [Acidimicrobiia bacterium]|nr:ABC transporter permease [Acidimicrobiia bacterium]